MNKFSAVLATCTAVFAVTALAACNDEDDNQPVEPAPATTVVSVSPSVSVKPEPGETLIKPSVQPSISVSTKHLHKDDENDVKGDGGL